MDGVVAGAGEKEGVVEPGDGRVMARTRRTSGRAAASTGGAGCACEAVMRATNSATPAATSRLAPDSSTTVPHVGSASRWRRSAATVAMSISFVQGR